MLQVRKNEIFLRQLSDGSAQLRTLQGTLVAKYALYGSSVSFHVVYKYVAYAISSSYSLHIAYLPRRLRSTVSHMRRNATAST